MPDWHVVWDACSSQSLMGPISGVTYGLGTLHVKVNRRHFELDPIAEFLLREVAMLVQFGDHNTVCPSVRLSVYLSVHRKCVL